MLRIGIVFKQLLVILGLGLMIISFQNCSSNFDYDLLMKEGVSVLPPDNNQGNETPVIEEPVIEEPVTENPPVEEPTPEDPNPPQTELRWMQLAGKGSLRETCTEFMNSQYSNIQAARTRVQSSSGEVIHNDTCFLVSGTGSCGLEPLSAYGASRNPAGECSSEGKTYYFEVLVEVPVN